MTHREYLLPPAHRFRCIRFVIRFRALRHQNPPCILQTPTENEFEKNRWQSICARMQKNCGNGIYGEMMFFVAPAATCAGFDLLLCLSIVLFAYDICMRGMLIDAYWWKHNQKNEPTHFGQRNDRIETRNSALNDVMSSCIMYICRVRHAQENNNHENTVSPHQKLAKVHERWWRIFISMYTHTIACIAHVSCLCGNWKHCNTHTHTLTNTWHVTPCGTRVECVSWVFGKQQQSFFDRHIIQWWDDVHMPWLCACEKRIFLKNVRTQSCGNVYKIIEAENIDWYDVFFFFALIFHNNNINKSNPFS